MQVAGGEGRLPWQVEAVVVDLAVTYDEAVDGQVELAVAGGVFGGQRVEHKLEVGLGLGRGLVEVSLETEELCRGDGDVAAHERQVVELGRQSGRA